MNRDENKLFDDMFEPSPFLNSKDARFVIPAYEPESGPGNGRRLSISPDEIPGQARNDRLNFMTPDKSQSHNEDKAFDTMFEPSKWVKQGLPAHMRFRDDEAKWVATQERTELLKKSGDPMATQVIEKLDKTSDYKNRDGLIRELDSRRSAMGPYFRGVLSPGPDAYERLAKLDNDAENKTPYKPDAKRTVADARSEIAEASRAFGVPKEAIAAAMLDESSRLGAEDSAQDWSAFVIDHDQIRNHVNKYPNEAERPRTWWNSSTWDIGKYNISASKGYELFEKYVQNPDVGDNPLRSLTLAGLPDNATDEQKWASFRNNCMLDPKGASYTVAAVLDEGYRAFAPYMQGMSPEEKAAMVVTYYKQGYEQPMNKYTDRIIREGRVSDLRPGEGARMYHNIRSIWDVIGENPYSK